MTDTPQPPHTSGDQTPDWAVVARFLAGESPVDEARAVSAWLDANPADAAMLRALDGVAAPPVALDDVPIDVEAALARVHARMDEAPTRDGGAGVIPFRRPAAPPALSRVTAAEPRRGRAAAWRYGGLAAAAVALIAVGLARRAADDVPTVVAAREVAASVGARDSLTLPDGSRVLLAPGSRLTVAAGYGGAARDVALDGEARFSVRHDAARPFRVRVPGAVVVDLGTEFTVRSASSDSESVAVSVFEGSVALDADSTPAGQPPAQPPRGGEGRGGGRGGVVLRPGDRGEVHPGGRVEAMRGAAADEDTAWTRGRLVFRGAPLSAVRADLRRWYGVDLRIDDPALADRRLTASFEGEPVDRVLNAIALAVGAEVERSGTSATLRRTARTPR